MEDALDPVGLLDLLQAGETVLLPTVRAAADWKIQFDLRQHLRGLRAWEPPPCTNWQGWLESAWRRLTLEGQDLRILLNPLQELHLWQEIITESPEGRTVSRHSLRRLAELAQSALQLAAAHVGESKLDRLHRSAGTVDAQAFAGWQKTFRERCAEEQLLSRSLLEPALEAHVQGGTLPMSLPSLHLAGFDRLSPAQTRLLDALREAGTGVYTHRIACSHAAAASRTFIQLPTPREELRWAGDWVRERFAQGSLDASAPPPRLALVLPDPRAERASFEPLLREVLTPELEVAGADLSSTPWHFSQGAKLATLPVIQHALLLLRWTQSDLNLDEVGALLLSSFLADDDPLETRARFETNVLRAARQIRREWSLSDLLAYATLSHKRFAPLKLAGLSAFHRLAGAGHLGGGSGSHADWAEFVRRLLRAAGWPGSRPLTPSGFKAVEAWEGLLDNLSTLDLRAGRLGFPPFLQLLTELAAELPVAEAISRAPLEILTLAETEGCTFDAAIVLRATDSNLPAPEQPHPLLGLELQRSLHLPGTDATLTHARSRNALKSLADRSGELLMAAALADENGPLRSTPLVDELRLMPAVAPFQRAERSEYPLVLTEEVLEPAWGLHLATAEVPGGVRSLQMQAACGFRAFGELRLMAGAPDFPKIGLDPRDRGSMLHVALDAFWAEVKSQPALRAMPSDRRRAVVVDSVRRALEGYRPSGLEQDTWAAAYLTITEKRFVGLLESWLELELERGEFTVLSREAERRVQVGPLQLKVRPDRIDQIEGGLVLVDYKTSSDLSAAQWLGERPEAPQLPLYSLLTDAKDVRGLAFARLRPGKLDWIGLQKEEGDIRHDRQTKIHDLEEQVALWRTELDRLATEFSEGVSTVAPKVYPHTCKYCDQRLLCRIAASALTGNEDENDSRERADG